MCIEHVKIREHKAVCLKCDVCSDLSAARRKFKEHHQRVYIRDLHAGHRSAYMGERLEYYKRRVKAELNPHEYLSIITDGMAQHHCCLPWCANIGSANTLPHHIQGLIVHGRKINIYRTFHNVGNGANLQIHTLLKTLEEIIKDDKKGVLPPTVYIQIDGGSENTAKAMLAICELLVARKLTTRVVLSRLIPGHTHEDIDSKFGIIWQRIRGTHVFTPQQWSRVIETCLTKEKNVMPCKVYLCVKLFCLCLRICDYLFNS
ncbi:MAG: hypothetical protein ACOVRN_11940 [Flavobacterium sp.]|jgi:hypothetical protein